MSCYCDDEDGCARFLGACPMCWTVRGMFGAALLGMWRLWV